MEEYTNEVECYKPGVSEMEATIFVSCLSDFASVVNENTYDDTSGGIFDCSGFSCCSERRDVSSRSLTRVRSM